LWISFGIFLYKMNKSPHEFEIAVGLIRTAWFCWSGWPDSVGPDGPVGPDLLVPIVGFGGLV
jgi:hypothetical protein